MYRRSNKPRSSALLISTSFVFLCLAILISKSVAALILGPQFSTISNSYRRPNSIDTTTASMSVASSIVSSSGGGSPNKEQKRCYVYGKDDALFGAIEKQQNDKPFGSFLDAGTGQHSLRWIATLFDKGMTDFTAVTADETMQANCQQEIDNLGITGTLVKGNWFDERQPLQLEQQFDVILADYLIGAMDGFSPYQQDLMIAKLSTYLKPEGGRLYIVGLQPIPDAVPANCLEPNAGVICRVRQVRDACILLAGHRCYREYPVDWVHRQIAGCPGLQLLQTKQFPILYRQATIVKQINVGRSKLKYMPLDLQKGMAQTLDDLEKKALRATTAAHMHRIQLGFDYVVTAEKTP